MWLCIATATTRFASAWPMMWRSSSATICRGVRAAALRRSAPCTLGRVVSARLREGARDTHTGERGISGIEHARGGRRGERGARRRAGVEVRRQTAWARRRRPAPRAPPRPPPRSRRQSWPRRRSACERRAGRVPRAQARIQSVAWRRFGGAGHAPLPWRRHASSARGCADALLLVRSAIELCKLHSAPCMMTLSATQSMPPSTTESSCRSAGHRAGTRCAPGSHGKSIGAALARTSTPRRTAESASGHTHT